MVFVGNIIVLTPKLHFPWKYSHVNVTNENNYLVFPKVLRTRGTVITYSDTTLVGIFLI